MPNSLILRPYQYETLEAIGSAYGEGHTRQLVVLPTGTGKTVIFAELCKQWNGRKLVLVHRDELVKQTYRKLVDAGINTNDIGIVKANDNECDAEVVIASVQTLCRARRMAEYLIFGAADLVVVDEAHHAPANSYVRVVNDALANNGLLVGVTATPDRQTTQHFINPTTKTPSVKVRGGMGKSFTHLTYYRSLVDMIGEGYLCDITPANVETEIETDRLEAKAGDWSADSLEREIDRYGTSVYDDIVQAWSPYSNRPTIVFLPTVKTSRDCRQSFLDHGYTAEHIDGTTPIEDRQRIYDNLREGRTRVVTNCMVLTEGFDEPSVSCIVVARPTRSRLLYAQMIGRGTRLFPDKDDCVVLSVVGHDLDVDPITLQTFLNDKGWVDGESLSKRKAKLALLDTTGDDLVAEAKAFTVKFDANPVNHTTYIWRKIGGAWLLMAGDIQVKVLERPGGQWEVFTPRGSEPGVSDLSSAVKIAEDYISKTGAGILANSRAKWRQDAPSIAQSKLAVALGLDRKLLDSMTKGDVANYITTAKLEGKSINWSRTRGMPK